MRLGLKIDDVDLYSWKRIMVKDRNIGNPNKKKVMEQIPFSNTPLDFSYLYGEQNFEERTIEYTLTLVPELRTRESSEMLKTQLVNLLMNKKQFKLYDEIFPNYYFLAEVRDGPNFEKTLYLGELTVTFTAYPFRIDELAEGNDIWDTFNFELDVAQVTEFDVRGSLNAVLINNGAPDVYPQIITSRAMTIVQGGIEYKLGAGTFTEHDFKLAPGENRFTIQGTGNIKFNFHKELI